MTGMFRMSEAQGGVGLREPAVGAEGGSKGAPDARPRYSRHR